MRKALKIILIILGIIILMALGVYFYFWIKSPGKLPALTDTAGHVITNSISEKGRIELGGVSQGYFIRGENPENPVILYLHGGPGSPELPLIMGTETPDSRLEQYFTICYWDQLGAGMSYDESIDPSSVNREQLIEDTRELTLYLMKRFNKEKIYLMGHSWGSYLGVKTAVKYPDYYYAYIGIGQVTNQLQSELLAYDYMLNHAQEINDTEAVKQLKKYDKDASGFPDFDYMMTVRSPLMNKYGIGIMHTDFKMSELVWDVLTFKGYTLNEKTNYAKGTVFSYNQLFHNVLSDNLFESSSTLQIPVYITHGRYDYQVSYALAKDYLDAVDAPRKEFFTFENSAHSPNMEEPQKFIQIIRDIHEQNGNEISSDLY